MSVSVVTLVRDSDGAEVAWEAHAGGDFDGRHTFAFYEARWQERGVLLASDPDSLAAILSTDRAGHTAFVQWSDA